MAGEKPKCCICGEKLEGYGNNPAPLAEKGRCCDRCNLEKVLPARMKAVRDGKWAVPS